jgi:phosphate/sulfate permease
VLPITPSQATQLLVDFCCARVCVSTADVANAFATSVGSRTLKLKWAIVIAVVGVTQGASQGCPRGVQG